MNDGVGQAVAADVAPPSGVVPVPARLFGHVETPDERTHWFAPFAEPVYIKTF
jgi:hypothetical protein